MNLIEKIGQMLVFGWIDDEPGDGITVNERAQALIEEFKVGGIILMDRNIASPRQLKALLSEMQAVAAESGLPPLFVSIDQEGGKVSRLKPPHFRATKSAWDLGLKNSPELVRREAGAIGDELLSLGINWDFAPVLDVNNNPANPVIGIRSFGDDAETVAELGAAAVRGFQEDAHVMACGKHFPGHGDTAVDSHAALPTISHSYDRLSSLELLPFRAAIDAGVAAIMSAHIMFPALDKALPATLSKTILTGLLRDELKFDGLVITDCLEMRGIADHWSYGEAAVLAVEAGADLLLCCHNRQPQTEIRDGLLDAVRSGRISELRIDQSTDRIRRAKERWLVRAPEPVLMP